MREIFAEIRITFYKDGDTECAWPDDEFVTRALLHKASAEFERHYQKAQVLKAMQDRPTVLTGDPRAIKPIRGLNGGKRH